LKYVWFDFHEECKKMKYENLSRLLTIIETDTSTMGMFEADIKKSNNNVLQKNKKRVKINLSRYLLQIFCKNKRELFGQIVLIVSIEQM